MLSEKSFHVRKHLTLLSNPRSIGLILIALKSGRKCHNGCHSSTCLCPDSHWGWQPCHWLHLLWRIIIVYSCHYKTEICIWHELFKLEDLHADNATTYTIIKLGPKDDYSWQLHHLSIHSWHIWTNHNQRYSCSLNHILLATLPVCPEQLPAVHLPYKLHPY